MPISAKPLQDSPALKNSAAFTHILSAMTAILILMGAAVYWDKLATTVENGFVNALAPILLARDANVTVIQKAAFRQPDLLPVYGSSEMVNVETDYRAYSFFENYPTGFQVFEIAKAGNSSLNIAQDLAAVGPDLYGKKVVISFTPYIFNFATVREEAYAGNFSRMNANSLIFNPHLSVSIKQRAAQRMLEYPETLAKDPVLLFALQNLAAGNFYNNFMVYLLTPLGQIHNQIIRLQEHYMIWKYLEEHPKIKPNIKRKPEIIDWNSQIAAADAQQKINANNAYGIANQDWINKYHQVMKIKKPGSGDDEYIANLEKSKEWNDLKLLLDVLKELGAKPLILSRPINGNMLIASGISSLAQQVYYTKLQNLVSAYNVPLVDFQEYTNDPYFSVDIASHTSPKGWVIVDKTLDAFYHDALSK
jgi:D-alanine transfer protein